MRKLQYLCAFQDCCCTMLVVVPCGIVGCMDDVGFDESARGRVLFLNRQADGMAKVGEVQAAKDALAAAHSLVDTISEAAEKQPLLAMTLNNLGCLHNRCGEYKRAITFLEAAARLEASLCKESAITWLNLTSALLSAAEVHRARDAAGHAQRVADLFQPSLAPLVLLQRAKVEAALVPGKARAWEQAEQAQLALERFHEAAACAPKPSSTLDQIIREMRDARSQFVKAGYLRPEAAKAPAKSQIPTLPKLEPRKPAPKSIYNTKEEARVRKVARENRVGQTARLPIIQSPRRTERVPQPPTATGKPARPRLVPPVLWTCPQLYGLQALFMVAEKKRRPVPAIRQVYVVLRTLEPLMPRFEFKVTAPAPPSTQQQRKVKHIAPALLKAVDLLAEQRQHPILRRYFARWRRTLPVFRRSKPLRRAAQHLILRSAETHLKMRWLTWSRGYAASNPHGRGSKPVVIAPRSAPATPPKSPLEELVSRWLTKITGMWSQIESDRNMYDDATVADDVAKLNRLKVDFARALSTGYEKHRDVPLTDAPALQAKLEPFLQLLLNEVENDESIALLNSLMLNLRNLDFRDMIAKGNLLRNCALDGSFRLMRCILDEFGDRPADGWFDILSDGLYDATIRLPLVDVVFSYPRAFPIVTVATELQPHWEHLCFEISQPSETEGAARSAVLQRLLTHDPALLDPYKPAEDECDLINRAAKSADLGLVKMLVEGAKLTVNSRLESGMTPLVQAILSDAPHVVEYLIEHKANTRALYNGMTPLQIARKLGQHASIVALLEECEAEDGPVAVAVRRSFVTTPAAQPIDTASRDDVSVEAFAEDELIPATAEGGDDVLSDVSSADTAAVEALLRNEALDGIAAEWSLSTLEIAPSDAPRRRIMMVEGRVTVADRISAALALCRLNRDQATGYVTITVAGTTLTLEFLGLAGSNEAVFEVLALDNGHFAFGAVNADNRLLEPDLALESSRLRLVPDEDASSFSEFIFTTVAKGDDDQTVVDAMKIARADTNSAKDRRRREKKRHTRLAIVQKFFTESFAEQSFIINSVDAPKLIITYDTLCSPNVIAKDVIEPLAQLWVVEADEDGFVLIKLREARHFALSAVDGEICVVPHSLYRWEVVELADGAMALESVETPGHLVEAKLDLEPHILMLVHESDASSFCELAVSKAVPLSQRVTSTSPDPAEHHAATRIQALQRRRLATKRVARMKQERDAEKRDRAAVKIQGVMRQRAARGELRRRKAARSSLLLQHVAKGTHHASCLRAAAALQTATQSAQLKPQPRRPQFVLDLVADATPPGSSLRQLLAWRTPPSKVVAVYRLQRFVRKCLARIELARRKKRLVEYLDATSLDTE
jgi:tetratricopeptide (TPR) repeat protein/ankyrin repeat protein